LEVLVRAASTRMENLIGTTREVQPGQREGPPEGEELVHGAEAGDRTSHRALGQQDALATTWQSSMGPSGPRRTLHRPSGQRAVGATPSLGQHGARARAKATTEACIGAVAAPLLAPGLVRIRQRGSRGFTRKGRPPMELCGGWRWRSAVDGAWQPGARRPGAQWLAGEERRQRPWPWRFVI
jgi:hypothetical protein